MRRGVLCLPHPGRGSAACPRFSPGAFGAEAVPRVLLAVNFVAEEAVCLGALGKCVQKCFSLDNNPRSMTCRSGVVSVAIVVRTARTTASVLTPEPIALRARTGRSGRAVYTPLRDGQCEGGAPTSRVTAARCRLRAAESTVVPTDQSRGGWRGGDCVGCVPGGAGDWCRCCPCDRCDQSRGCWRGGDCVGCVPGGVGNRCACAPRVIRFGWCPRSRIGCAFMDRLFACG